jgi:DNA-binding transcriptional regulator YiaG
MQNQQMTGAELRDAQDALAMTNKQFVYIFRVTEATLCNWKADRAPIPTAVSIALRLMMAHPEDAPNGWDK